MSDEHTLEVSCLCRNHQYSFHVPTSSLPIKQSLCHCDISRRISGCLFTSYVPIPHANPPPDLSGLTKYKSSEILSRYFCSTCSTHLYLEYNEDGDFEVSHGTIRGKTDDILSFEEHMWIYDTKDGGASPWIRSISDKTLKRWLERPDDSAEAPLGWRRDDPDKTSIEPKDKLQVRCHCNGVNFQIGRPSLASLEASSPLPDLLVPYSSGKSAANPENKPWWLSTDRTKYFAGTCACDSCRQVCGFDITPWAFIPIANFDIPPHGRSFEHRPFGTLKSYVSAIGPTQRTRWFCSRCGANVFWTGNERMTLIDVSVGLLDAPSGARAEDWLQWDLTERVSFPKDAHNLGLVEALQQGLKDFYTKES